MQRLGFKTFGDLWDEGYDTCEGPDRYKRIMTIVKNVANMSASDQLELYENSRQICRYNKQRLIALSRQRVNSQ
jgi:hypothetical protein